MVDVDGIAAYQRTHNFTSKVGWFGLRVGGHLALSLHSSNELGELSQWPRHDDSTINIVMGIVMIYMRVCRKTGSV